MSMQGFMKAVLAMFCGLATAAAAQVPTYDGATKLLSIPAVQVGATTFSGVTLLNTGDFRFALQTATEQTHSGLATATYDGASSVLTIPAVLVGETTFLDVTLLNQGNFLFALQTATEMPAATVAEVKALVAKLDTLWAVAVPSPASVRASLSDSCWVDDGRTQPNVIEFLDANPVNTQLRDAFQIGRRSSNLQILAQRNSRNPDGSQRSELDVQYDIAYTDGTTALAAKTTLINGSSAGSPGCITPTNSAAWRLFGNRKIIHASVRARSQRDERYSISTGAALSPAVNYRRDLNFFISDPMGNASYVILTGPGPVTNANGASVPFSLKFVSVRNLRSAPELLGKNGNFVNYLDEDSWRFCRVVGAAVPTADTADCVGQGATGNTYGWTTSTPNAAADQGFDGFGFVAGGSYTFAVYNDTGWKTINGHAGRTPIATYTAVLAALPHSFVEMAGSGASADKFPRMAFGGLSKVQIKDNLLSATPSTMNVSWNALPALADGGKHGLFQYYEFFQGAALGNLNAAFYPAYRYLTAGFPGSAALAATGWPTSAKPANMNSKTYAEYTLQYLDRNNRHILSLVSFQ